MFESGRSSSSECCASQSTSSEGPPADFTARDHHDRLCCSALSVHALFRAGGPWSVHVSRNTRICTPSFRASVECRCCKLAYRPPPNPLTLPPLYPLKITAFARMHRNCRLGLSRDQLAQSAGRTVQQLHGPIRAGAWIWEHLHWPPRPAGPPAPPDPPCPPLAAAAAPGREPLGWLPAPVRPEPRRPAGRAPGIRAEAAPRRPRRRPGCSPAGRSSRT